MYMFVFKTDCGPLGVPEHGHVEYSSNTTFGTIANYSCASPYAVVGDTQRECLDTGIWSNSDPRCEING